MVDDSNKKGGVLSLQDTPQQSEIQTPPRRVRLGPNWLSRLLIALLASIFFLFLGIPLLSLVLHESPAAIWGVLQQPDTLQALQLSLLATCVSTFFVVVFGLPVAYVLARIPFPGRNILDTLVTLPTVLPPVVAGVALLLAFGRVGLLGHYLNLIGITLPFTTVAVMIAQIFISAPFFINSAKS